MKRNLEDIKRALFFGVLGTAVMTAFTFVAPHIHLPSADLHATLAGMFHLGNVGTTLLYFGVGTLLAYLYAGHLRHRLPTGRPWLRGVFYAVVLFFVAHVIVMPAFGMGFFASSITSLVGTLLVMAAYGATVGYLYDQK